MSATAAVTRCPSCGTAFRFVADQLRLSKGKVRCGQCNHVFLAEDHRVSPAAEVADPTAAALASNPPPPGFGSTPLPAPQIEFPSPPTAQPTGPLSSDPLPTNQPPTNRPPTNQPPTNQPPTDPSPTDPSPSRPELTGSLPSGPTPVIPADDWSVPIEPRRTVAEPLLDFPVGPPTAATRGSTQEGQRTEPQFASTDELSAPDDSAREPKALEQTPEGPGSDVWSPAQDPLWSVSSDEAARHRTEPAQSLLEDIPTQGASRSQDLDDLDLRFDPVPKPSPSPTKDPALDILLEPLSSDRLRFEPSFARPKPVSVWQRWGRGLVWVMLFCAILQATYLFRTPIALAVPPTRPILESACDWLGCEVQWARRLQLLSIESSALEPVTDAPPGTLALRMTLRNRHTQAQDWPLLELTLTDRNDRPVVRRVIQPAEYLEPDRLEIPLSALSSEEFSVTLSASLPVAGYRVSVFY